jgi:hypothetical protein
MYFEVHCFAPDNVCGDTDAVCDLAASEVCLLGECKTEGVDVFSCADSYCKIPDEACLIVSTSSGETEDRCVSIGFQCSLFGDVASLCSDTTNFNYVPAADGSNAQLPTSGFASSFCIGGAECTSQGATPTTAPASVASTTRFLSFVSVSVVGATAAVSMMI